MTLRAAPGERQAAVITVPAGAVVTVLEERGRWVRVQVGARGKTKVGWVTRTTLAAPDAASPTDTDAPPSAAWSESATVAPTPAPPEPAPAVVTAATTTRTPRRATVHADLDVGYRSLDMHFTSDGGSGLANYLVSADAAVAGLVVDLRFQPSHRLFAGIDGGVRTTYSSPGLDYAGPTLPPGQIAFTMFETDAGLRAGVGGAGFDVSLRAGAHYGAFLAEEVANAGRLPRERLRAITAGVRGDVHRPRSRVAVQLAVDVMLAGDRAQTPGLEDGQTSDAGALWAMAMIRYRIGRRWSAHGGLLFTRATTTWQGASVRYPDVMSAHRVDQSETVQLGVGAEL